MPASTESMSAVKMDLILGSQVSDQKKVEIYGEIHSKCWTHFASMHNASQVFVKIMVFFGYLN